MTLDSFAGSICQAALCFSSIAVLRLGIIYLGARIGAILIGTPIIMFPLLAIQAWHGPAVTPGQTAGSVASMTAVACALWVLRLPLKFTPLSILLTMASAWLAIISAIHATVLPVQIMTAMVIANALFIFIRYRNHQPPVAQTNGKLTDGAVPITIFLIVFFMITRLVPDFVRGVLVSFPIGLLATLWFVRRLLTLEGFENFVIYTHGAITAGAIFVIGVHFSIIHMSVASSLAISLVASIATSALAGLIWRPRAQSPSVPAAS
jgi:hypothetical protein